MEITEKTSSTQDDAQDSTKYESDAASNISRMLQRFPIEPIGFMRTCFPEKNGTPRQGILCQKTRGKLSITCGNNPHHFLEGIGDFNYVHLIFLFHQNSLTTNRIKPKIAPPRLNGKKVGVFATRSPHRPNPIGLTIARVDRIEDNTIHFSGIDLVDGTPILDIKPYVPQYDSFPEAKIPDWIISPPVTNLNVEFMPEPLEQLKKLIANNVLEFYDNVEDVRIAVEEVLSLDPRSLCFKKSNDETPYGFCLDCMNIVCEFDKQDPKKVKIVEVQDWSETYGRGKRGKDYNRKVTDEQVTKKPRSLKDHQ